MAPTKMRPFTSTIPLERALEILHRTGTPIDRSERVAIGLANGRVLAHDVVAPADAPPFTRAAMDGYAVRSIDTHGARTDHTVALTQTDALYTGQSGSGLVVHEGECVAIATGAPLPEGADAVVMVEDTTSDDTGRVRVRAAVGPNENIGQRGADIKSGSVVLSAGDAINSSRVGALAAVGIATVEVYARPRVAILSTGNEIIEPGQPLLPGQIYDINRFTLSAVVADNGGEAVPYPSAPDSLDALVAVLARCVAENDIVVFSGGSSVGERDLMIDALSATGDVLFHGIAIKPGKPTGLATVAGKPVLAMPGYPASCLTNAHILLVPLLRRLARLAPKRMQTVALPLSQRIVSAKGRHQFYSVKVAGAEAVPAFKASGDITSMSRADGYIEIPADVEFVERGSLVNVTLF